MCSRQLTSPHWRTFSSVVKNSILHIVFVLICLIVFGAVQDSLSSFGGVKAPLLLAYALSVAFTAPDAKRSFDRTDKGDVPAWIFIAIASGAFIDALTGFPHGFTPVYFLLACAAARFVRGFLQEYPRFVAGLIITAIAAGVYELWLVIWGVANPDSSILVRFFAAAFLAMPTGAVVFAAIPVLEKHAGIHDEETAVNR